MSYWEENRSKQSLQPFKLLQFCQYHLKNYPASTSEFRINILLIFGIFALLAAFIQGATSIPNSGVPVFYKRSQILHLWKSRRYRIGLSIIAVHSFSDFRTFQGPPIDSFCVLEIDSNCLFGITPPPLCFEWGFTRTFPRNQDVIVKLKSELISSKF